MAGFIKIDALTSWSSPNWVYRNLMDEINFLLSNQGTLSNFIEQCKWMQSLNLQTTAQEFREDSEKIIMAITEAARRCSAGTVMAIVDGKHLDAESQKQFQESTLELLTLLDKHVSGGQLNGKKL